MFIDNYYVLTLDNFKSFLQPLFQFLNLKLLGTEYIQKDRVFANRRKQNQIVPI